jgi:hypothetical protein
LRRVSISPSRIGAGAVIALTAATQPARATVKPRSHACVSICITSVSRTDNTPTVWHTADGLMCLRTHRATIRREKRAQRGRGEGRGARQTSSWHPIGPGVVRSITEPRRYTVSAVLRCNLRCSRLFWHCVFLVRRCVGRGHCICAESAVSLLYRCCFAAVFLLYFCCICCICCIAAVSLLYLLYLLPTDPFCCIRCI